MQKIRNHYPMLGRVLLTRANDKNRQLARLLADHGISSHSTSLLNIIAIDDQHLAAKLAILTVDDIVIAISANAVIYANKQLDAWPNTVTYLAVGQASTDAFFQVDISASYPDEATSEGLLSMPELSDVKDKRIVILRGEGGRETLAQQLVKRGAKVSYSQLYRRQSIVSNKENDLLKWQQLKITIIVVTSAETLLTLVARVIGDDLEWLQRCTIIVPSRRVAKIADENGLTHVEIAAGASNQAILQQLLTLQSSLNEK